MRKPIKVVSGVLGVVGRVLLCSVFVAVALGYAAPDIHSLAENLAAKSDCAPKWVLYGEIALLATGCLSVILGYKARFGALALLAFLVLTLCFTPGFTFWNVVSSQARHDHIAFLVTNLSIMGATLFIVINGSGKMSLDGNRA